MRVPVTFELTRKKDDRKQRLKGVAVAFTSRGKRIIAVVHVKRTLVPVPIEDLRVLNRHDK